MDFCETSVLSRANKFCWFCNIFYHATLTVSSAGNTSSYNTYLDFTGTIQIYFFLLIVKLSSTVFEIYNSGSLEAVKPINISIRLPCYFYGGIWVEGIIAFWTQFLRQNVCLFVRLLVRVVIRQSFVHPSVHPAVRPVWLSVPV